MCIHVLPAKAYDLIVLEYDLEEVGYGYRQGKPSFLNSQEQDQAVGEARQWFNRALEQMLQAAERDLPSDRETVQKALELLRGKDIEDIMNFAFAENQLTIAAFHQDDRSV